MIPQETLTVRIPMTIRRIGGRKQIIVPEGEGIPERPRSVPDQALLKALARAFKWKRMIEEGQVRSLNELAEAEKLNGSYVSRIFRLTLLAPDIVEAILAGRQPRTLQLADLLEDVPVEWVKQRELFIEKSYRQSKTQSAAMSSYPKPRLSAHSRRHAPS